MFATWLPDNNKGTSEPFPEWLAQQAADLCRRLSVEREHELAHARSELQEERDRLKAENVRLQSELIAQKVPAEANNPLVGRRDVPTVQLAPLASPVDADLTPPTPPSRLTVEGELLGINQVSPKAQLLEAGRDAQAAKASAATVGGPLIEEATTSSQTEETPEEGHSMRQVFKLAVISSDHVGAADSNLFLLRKVYKDLDRRNLGLVSAQDIVARTQRKFQGNKIPDLQSAIQEVNKQLAGHLNPKVKNPVPFETHPLELTFEGFQYLIIQKNLEENVPAAVAGTIREIREFYVTWTTEVMILEKTRVHKDDLDAHPSKDKVPVWLEPTVGVLILLNALCIGMSLDLWEGSPVWAIVETAFSSLFFLELILKLHFVGFSEHFFGPIWVWNWFDLCIVVIAFVGICMDVLSNKSELNTLTVIRLIRLIRMGRLVRLLRMKVFKELALMVNGVIGGLKTLFWAFVFLTVLIFILGVFMRQTVNDECNAEALSLAASNTTQEVSCFVKENHQVLFSTVLRSMFTVFRCVIGDCTDQKGQPIAVELMEHFGHVFTVVYVTVTCFVLFGVFNLIAAVFVENTLEAARVSQQKRHQARTKEHIRVAHQLKDIVLRICKRYKRTSEASVDECCSTLPQAGSFKKLRRGFESMLFGRGSSWSSSTSEDDIEVMEMVVSRPVFEEVMAEPAVVDILDDLEIHVADKTKLFDIIDSNGSGSLDVGEIIEGLLALRGPADKGDIVCASLMVRSVQRHLHRLDAEMHERHRVLHESQEALVKTQANIVRCLSARGCSVTVKPSKALGESEDSSIFCV